MSGFKSLAEMRKGRGSINDLQKEVEKLNQTSYEKDDRYWQPTVDKAGTGAALIRFLPAPQGEDLPWVRYWNHAFEGPTGKWYIENCLTTLGQADPVAELNTELWNSGDEETARKQKRKLHYVSNILVVKDPKNPDTEGRVFLFKYGVKIFDKVKDAMNPPDELGDAEPLNPFDFWEGANFKLVIQNVKNYRNYDKSEFLKTSAVSDSDAQIEEIWASQHSLSEVVAPDKFKSYDELKKKLDFVLNNTSSARAKPKAEDTTEDSAFEEMTKRFKKPVVDDEDEKPKAKTVTKKPVVEVEEEVEQEVEEEVTPKPKAKVAAKKAPAKKEPVEEEDDTLSYFADLAADD